MYFCHEPNTFKGRKGMGKEIHIFRKDVMLSFILKKHKTFRITPAMAAGLTKRLMTIGDIVRLTD